MSEDDLADVLAFRALPNFSAQKRSRIHSTDDDAKLAGLAAQFCGRDDAKKKEENSERKKRSATWESGTREAKKEVEEMVTEEEGEGRRGIYWPEYLRGVELDAPPPKSRS